MDKAEKSLKTVSPSRVGHAIENKIDTVKCDSCFAWPVLTCVTSFSDDIF